MDEIIAMIAENCLESILEYDTQEYETAENDLLYGADEEINNMLDIDMEGIY